MLTIEMAFEAVKSGSLLVQDAAIALDTASQLLKSTRKNQGVTYTPWNVALQVVSQANPLPTEHWLDTSIGRGMFLWATLFHMKTAGASGPDIEEFLHCRIHGVELDPLAANHTHKLLAAWCASESITPPPPTWLVQGDSLQAALPSVDVMVGNPPYVRIQHLDAATRACMRKQFSACANGNVDLYYAFFEQALFKAKRGALIAPNSWLTNNSASMLRQLVASRTTKVIDFYQTLLFAPVRAYTSVWVWNQEALCTPKVERQDGWSGVPVAQSRIDLKSLEGAPWPDPLRIATMQSASMTPLHELATVHSGVATLADKVYSVRLVSQDKTTQLWECNMFDGSREWLEPAALVPLYKWTKTRVAPGGLLPGIRAIIYPYDTAGKVWSESDFQSWAPFTLDYLKRHRPLLSKRDKGAGKYETWFAYGRRQGLYSLHTQALGISTMWSGPTTPVSIHGAFNPYVFVSGYVVQPLPGVSLVRLQAALAHADVWEQVQARGKMWAGDKPYRTLGAPLLRSVLVPY